MKGPEPVASVICVLGSVSATRLGIMKATLPPVLPSDSITRPNGSRSTILMVLSSGAVSSATKDNSVWPVESRAPQRRIEATQSAPVTGVPSCHSSPSRRVKVYVSLSGETSHLSTICGLVCSFSSSAEQRVVDEIAVMGRDQRGGPDRIDDLEVRMHDRPQHRLGGRRLGRRQPKNGEQRQQDAAQTHHFFSTFHSASSGTWRRPVMLVRIALGVVNWPSGTKVGYSVRRTDTCSAISFCLAGSVSLA